MRTMTLEELLMKEDDGVILDIYDELDSCVVPATGYAHAYCRKVNELINAGKLCTVRDKYRNVYLPTLSKLIFKEMSRRYAAYCRNCKAPAPNTAAKSKTSEDSGDLEMCSWCGIIHDSHELHNTDVGRLCDTCIAAMRSHGDKVSVHD